MQIRNSPVVILLLMIALACCQAEADLQMYIDRLQTLNPQLQAAKKQFETVRLNVRSSMPFPQPSLEAGTPIGSTIRLTEIALSQRIPWPARFHKNREIWRYRAEAESLHVDHIRNELLFQLRSAYAELYGTGRKMEFLRENLTLLTQAMNLSVTGYETGRRMQTDVLKLQVECAIAQDDIAAMENKAEIIRERIAELAVLQSETVDIPDSLPMFSVPASLKDMHTVAVERNPLLLSHERKTRAARSAVTLAKTAFKPDFSAKISYEPAAGFEQAGQWSLMGGIVLPLWYRSRLVAIRQAKSMVEKQQQLFASEKNTLTTKTTSMYRIWADAVRRIDLLDRVLIPTAEQSFSVSESAYSTGLLGVLDLIEAQRKLVSLRVQRVDQVVRREKAAADIVLCCLGSG